MQLVPLPFDSPVALVAGLLVAAVGVGIAVYRNPAAPALTKILGGLGLLLLAAAAGGPGWRRDEPRDVVVMVDLSPSTRTAQYRGPGALRARIRQLLDDAPYSITYFADDAVGVPRHADGTPLPDAAAGARTTFVPPACDVVLLFSDAQFELPVVVPPTYVVVDPALEGPPDAAVERLEVRDGELVATFRNAGRPRAVTLSPSRPGPSTAPSASRLAPTGGVVMTQPLPPAPVGGPAQARLAPGDAWPENDVLSIVPAPPPETQRWWVGTGTAGDGWVSFSPAHLPADAAAFLQPSVIVLDNIAASDLGGVRQQRLRQYVRDLGGGLVIVGGDRAFAAGGYAGSALDALSPLASHPPEPVTHWVFLVDSSGSMNAPAGGAGAGGGTRWQAATAAVAAALPALPPQDLVSVGGFAAAVDWWLRGTPAEAARAGALPPPAARPSGPTELRAALEAAASAGAANGPRVELLVLTDANAPVERPADLAAVMVRNNVRLHLLDIADAGGAGLPALLHVVAETGGRRMRQADPDGWAAAVQTLARAASPDLLVREPGTVEFTGPLAGTPPRVAAPPWNRTWVKPGASEAARTSAGGGSAVAAAWEAGEGRVLAAAFGATPADVGPLVRYAARPPRDPRLRVTWDVGEKLRVVVDAVDAVAGPGEPVFLNGLPLTLALRDAAAEGAGTRAAERTVPVPQVAPGRYEVSLDAPAVPSIVTVRREGQTIDRAAVAGRYPPEYDRIGNDRGAMRALADRSGGGVVEPGETRPLTMPVAEETMPLTSGTAAIAAACVALGLIGWRRA